jgi:YVTN family beta-propeller protein
VTVCQSPHDIAILPDSSKAFVACPGSDQVASLDLQAGKLLALLDVGKRPENLALKPDGGELFVSNRGSHNISIIETTTNEVGNTFLVGDDPADLVVSADNAMLYVANSGSNSVAVYTIDEGRLACSGAQPGAARTFCALPTGRDPEILALSPQQNFLLVLNAQDGAVAVIRTSKLPQGSKISAERALFTMIPVGLQPNQIAVKAFVANGNSF